MRTQVLSKSPESCCAMHFAESVTKLPPLLQRHRFMAADVSPWHPESSLALSRQVWVPAG